jgi:hypothetical protein
VRLVVHIGAPKTASTYLQHCLGLNEDILRKHGIYLPQAGRRDTRANHHNLAWQLRDDSRFRTAHGGWGALTAEVADVDADVVLLSSEAFTQLASDEQLRRGLSRRLFDVADAVSLVYVVRDPLARINSMYTQTVKSFANPGTFDEYATRLITSPLYDLEKSFRFWYEDNRAEFVAIRFDQFVGEGPLQSLLGVIGVDIPADELTIPQEVSNPTPGPIAVEAIRLLNARLRVIDPRFSRRSAATSKLSQIVQRRASKAGWNEGKFWGWDREEAVWAADQLAASNERFSQAVWGEPWPLGAPTTKTKTAIALVDQPNRVRHSVDDYVAAMTRRYLSLLEDVDNGNVTEEENDDEVVDEVADELTDGD